MRRSGVLRAVHHQADAGRVRRALHHVDEAADARAACRGAPAGRGPPRRARACPSSSVRAAGDAPRREASRSSKPHFSISRVHELEDLLDARLDDLAEDLPRRARAGAAADRRHLDRLVLVDHARPARSRSCCLIRSASCGGVRRPMAMSLVRWLPPSGDDAVWTMRAVGEDGDVGGAAADVDQRDAELLLVLAPAPPRRGERLEHDVGTLRPRAVGALDDVLRRRRPRR